jgi:DNA-binding FadR family transcriptional regulator
VRLQQLEDGQIEAEHTVKEHQIHVSVDTIFQCFESVANATHNALLIEIARTINRARERTDWGELKLHEGTPQDHEGMLEALIRRNAKLAHERTKAHLLYARRSLLGGTG